MNTKRYQLQIRGSISDAAWTHFFFAENDNKARAEARRILSSCSIAGSARSAFLWNDKDDLLRKFEIERKAMVSIG